MSRGLLAYLYSYLSECDSFRALVDETDGIRRMDRPAKGTFRKCVCMGRVIRGNVPGLERRPIQYQSVAFSIWIRPELTDMGDVVLEDIEDELMKRLVWVGDEGFPAQDCVGQEPPVIVFASEFVADETEPNADEESQAWTKRLRIRFVVGTQTCLPIADTCLPCDPVPEFITIPAALLAGTGFTQVSPQQEHLIPERDLYVAHPEINTATFEAFKKADSIAIAYTTTSLIGQYASDWFQGIRHITTELDYWHTDEIMTGNMEERRIEHSANLWHVRPSISLADRMADFVITNINPYFSGVFCDEAYEDPPEEYLDAYRTGVEWVEADLELVKANWRAMHAHYLARLKSHFLSTRAVVANSAGKPYANADGIWIEHEHVDANGVEWAMGKFGEQKTFWEENDNRFVHPNAVISSELNVKGGPTLDPIFSIPGLVWPGTDS